MGHWREAVDIEDLVVNYLYALCLRPFPRHSVSGSVVCIYAWPSISILLLYLVTISQHNHIMSAFTFDFDLQDDLDESFDAISLQDSTAVPPRPADGAIIPEGITSEKELPTEEIPITALVRVLPFFSTSNPSYHQAGGSAALRAP